MRSPNRLRDYEELARALVTSIRGRRSRQRLSERLGYTTNALYTWETGIAYPSATRFFQLAELVGLSSEDILSAFLSRGAKSCSSSPLSSADGIQDFLQHLLGATKIVELANSSGLSRYSLGRWLKAQTEPRLPQLLQFIDHASLRLPDFLDALTEVTALPHMKEEWETLQAARSAGYDLPLSHAVLRAVETATYRQSCGDDSAIAKMLNVSPPMVKKCLTRLEQGAQIKKDGSHWLPLPSFLVDFRKKPKAAQRAKAFWAHFAAERSEERRSGLFSYNVFAVSKEDHARLEALQRQHLARMRTIIAESEPTDVVVLSNIQLFALDEEAADTPSQAEHG